MSPNSDAITLEQLRSGLPQQIMTWSKDGDDKIYTPELTSCLDGITRDAVFSICEELNIPLKEETLTRDELYLADEIFLTGTAAEITPIREIDNRMIGNGSKGGTTDRIQKTFFDAVAGKAPKFKHWLTEV